MSYYVLNTDEAQPLDIVAAHRRTFAVTLDLGRPLTGSYKMQVRDWGGRLILALTGGDGITVAGQKLLLGRTAQQMNVSTGVFSYELIETANGQVINLTAGRFTILPSVTEP